MLTSQELAGLHDSGFAIVRQVVPDRQLEEIIEHLPNLKNTAGTRTLLDLEWARTLATSGFLYDLAAQVLGPSARPIRGILFDKSPASNWNLSWHQDTKIPVRLVGVTAPEGFINWTTKEGITHCQPPQAILENCIALRLHLDPSGKENGALWVVPGSHMQGLAQEPPKHALETATVLEADAGDVILMRPLTWHAPFKSENPAHRRVIHIEYCSADLPGDIEWAFN